MDPIPQEEFKELVLENEDSPKQQHPEGLPGTFTQAALERVGEEKIPTQGIENAEDSSDGNQNSLKQILGNPDPGTNDTASAARRRTNSVISRSDARPIQENIFDFDIDLILQKEFEELALENEDYKTALEMMNLYDNEDVEQNIRDFFPLFTTIWRPIQLKIVMRTLERHLANDVIKLGEQFRSNKNFIHAVVSFYAAGKLYKWQNDGNNSVERISDCVDRIFLIVTAMNKQPELKPIVIDHVLPLMHEMTHMLRSIPRSTSDIRAKTSLGVYITSEKSTTNSINTENHWTFTNLGLIS